MPSCIWTVSVRFPHRSSHRWLLPWFTSTSQLRRDAIAETPLSWYEQGHGLVISLNHSSFANDRLVLSPLATSPSAGSCCWSHVAGGAAVRAGGCWLVRQCPDRHLSHCTVFPVSTETLASAGWGVSKETLMDSGPQFPCPLVPSLCKGWSLLQTKRFPLVLCDVAEPVELQFLLMG